MSSEPRPYIPYSIPLGDAEFARLVLPHDLSTDEAGRLCAVIRSLAFTDKELAAAEAEVAAWRAERQKAAGSLGALMAEWAAADDEPGIRL